MKTLCTAHLHDLPTDVARPAYDRAAVRPGIVHLGLGAFHRAHQAVATDDCLAAGERGWGITAVSMRSPAVRDALAPQDHLYTLVTRGAEGEACRVIGSIGQSLVLTEEPERVLSALAAPDTRIVTLTVTEKGYGIDPASGQLRADDPDLAHDLAHPGRPRTVLGLLAEALRRRRAAGHALPTLLSCDNLAMNGRRLHRALVDFASLRDPAMGRFLEDAVASPCCMVDRIVPATTEADRASVAHHLGLADAWPVVTEPFFQWVIEDRFPQGRPGWERAGVEFVDDVAPYEHMKLRLLNGAHTLMAACGRVLGRQYVSDAAADPDIRALVGAYWAEVAQTLPAGLDTPAYTARLLRRFDNPALHHRLAQIAADGSQKLPPRFIVPLVERRAQRAPVPVLLFAIAAWIRSTEGRDEGGRLLPIDDPRLDAWTARPGPDVPAPAAIAGWLDYRPLFPEALAKTPDIADALAAHLAAIRAEGLRTALRRVVAR